MNRISSAGLAACILGLIILLFPGCSSPVSGGAAGAPAVSSETEAGIPLSARISNSGELIRAIRGGLKRRARSITISFDYGSDIFDEVNGVVDDWMELALAETEDPAEGDYIRFQYGGYTLNSAKKETEGRMHYTLTITPEYYSWLYQEEAVDEAAAELTAKLFPAAEADGTGGQPEVCSQAERIRIIYDYLCSSVRYDEIHRKNPHYHEKSTAYAALVRHTATCQGYCTALYRLLREAGVSCRIVTGKAVREDGETGEDLHAWVIAGAEGRYYILDPTWDAGREESEWQYFLLGEEESAGHVPGGRFAEKEFRERYPLAARRYMPQDTETGHPES